MDSLSGEPIGKMEGQRGLKGELREGGMFM